MSGAVSSKRNELLNTKHDPHRPLSSHTLPFIPVALSHQDVAGPVDSDDYDAPVGFDDLDNDEWLDRQLQQKRIRPGEDERR